MCSMPFSTFFHAPILLLTSLPYNLLLHLSESWAVACGWTVASTAHGVNSMEEWMFLT